LAIFALTFILLVQEPTILWGRTEYCQLAPESIFTAQHDSKSSDPLGLSLLGPPVDQRTIQQLKQADTAVLDHAPVSMRFTVFAPEN
jgi:hypothetical protein